MAAPSLTSQEYQQLATMYSSILHSARDQLLQTDQGSTDRREQDMGGMLKWLKDFIDTSKTTLDGLNDDADHAKRLLWYVSCDHSVIYL